MYKAVQKPESNKILKQKNIQRMPITRFDHSVIPQNAEMADSRIRLGTAKNRLLVRRIQQYTRNQPEIYQIRIDGPDQAAANHLANYPLSRADMVSRSISPVISVIGNYVSDVLHSLPPAQLWNSTDNELQPNTLNPFNVVFSFPGIGIHAEIEFHSNGSSYLRHSFIQQTPGVGAFREYFSENGLANMANHVTAGQLGLQGVARVPDSYSERHNFGGTVGNALNGTVLSTGDALSVAAVESARFTFLQGNISNIRYHDWLRFHDGARDQLMQLSTLLSRFDNISKYKRQQLWRQGNPNNPGPNPWINNIPGWEFYGLTIADVLAWIHTQHSNDFTTVPINGIGDIALNEGIAVHPMN